MGASFFIIKCDSNCKDGCINSCNVTCYESTCNGSCRGGMYYFTEWQNNGPTKWGCDNSCINAGCTGYQSSVNFRDSSGCPKNCTAGCVTFCGQFCISDACTGGCT